jgi:hypothetical protein
LRDLETKAFDEIWPGFLFIYLFGGTGVCKGFTLAKFMLYLYFYFMFSVPPTHQYWFTRRIMGYSISSFTLAAVPMIENSSQLEYFKT